MKLQGCLIGRGTVVWTRLMVGVPLMALSLSCSTRASSSELQGAALLLSQGEAGAAEVGSSPVHATRVPMDMVNLSHVEVYLAAGKDATGTVTMEILNEARDTVLGSTTVNARDLFDGLAASTGNPTFPGALATLVPLRADSWTIGLADGQRFGIRYVIRIYRSDANQTGTGYYNAVWWAQGYENRYAAGRASTDLAPPYQANDFLFRTFNYHPYHADKTPYLDQSMICCTLPSGNLIGGQARWIPLGQVGGIGDVWQEFVVEK